MLLELAAANAAFAVIKEAVANGGDLLSAGQAIFTYFDSKTAIAKKAQEGGMKSDLEEFMALEQLKQQEIELKNMMIYQGRPGMWDDWLHFQVEARKKREKEEAAERYRKQQIVERIKTTGMVALLITMLGGVGFIIAAILIMGRHNF
jgi:preprotein translocase subunit Sss1